MKKIIATLILLVIGIALIVIFKSLPQKPISQTQEQTQNITITKAAITDEENFTGSYPIIVGDSVLANQAQNYVLDEINTFRDEADEQVPPMREQFGADSPTAAYTLDIGAELKESSTTQSIIISEYRYTGGANGMSQYTVYTASKTDGHIMSLSEVIKADKQEAFVAYVKNKLLQWKPEGMEETPVFKESVDALTFDSFKNWSLDNDNLVIYFSKYDIGPGALGAIDFPLSKNEIKDFLITN